MDLPGYPRQIARLPKGNHFGSFYFPLFHRSGMTKTEFEKEVDSKFDKPSNPTKMIRPIRSSFDEEDV